MRCVLWHSGLHELPGDLLVKLTQQIGGVTVCTEGYAALAEACLADRAYRERQHASGAPITKGKGGVLVLVQPEQLALAAQIVEAAENYAPNLQVWKYDCGANPKLGLFVSGGMASTAARPTYFQKPPQQAGAPSPTPQIGEPKPRSGEVAASAVNPASVRTGMSLVGSEDRRVPEARPIVAISGPGLGAPVGGLTAVNASGNGPRLRIAGTEADTPAPSGSAGTRAGSLLSAEELQMLLSDEPIPPAPTRAPNGQRGGER